MRATLRKCSLLTGSRPPFCPPRVLEPWMRVLEARLATVESELESEVAQEVREDYAEIATGANCPGYDAEA
jgi:hypothetical protein